MPSDTAPNDYPYPLSSEPMADLAAAVQALAEAVEAKLGGQKSGTVNSGTMVAGTTKTVAVVFATPFPAAGPVPRVVASLTGGQGTNANSEVTVAAITRNGFNLLFNRATLTGALDASWQATNVGNP